MKVKEITVGASRTINLGNYESLKIEGWCTMGLDENDEVGLVRLAAMDEVKTQLKEMYNEFRPKKGV
jgi:hypothetical protein